MEYALNKDLGVTLSSGYLIAPMGTSKNYTVGAAVNYHFSHNARTTQAKDWSERSYYSGIRFNFFNQTEFLAKVDDKSHHNIHMISFQIDKLLAKNWYIPIQGSIAYNDFMGYPGYGELSAGLGLQTQYSSSNRFQNFVQLQFGTNIGGIIFKPSLGVNYSLSDNYALFGQLGYTTSIEQMGLYRKNHSLRSYNVGTGITYRFSIK
ncbi:hypothetical protein [Sulfurimonas sp.]|uniref:hypothetical protein n=1 Tax=Sulfurimonas sp. TaxID=2022749 RepID=UPI002605E696|nr:hypothetical protein [Sulfurimonas sp.]